MEGLKAWAFMDKVLAEIAFKEQNFKLAALYAKNAKSLHKNLDGIVELVKALKVIDSAERETNEEEVDRYKVLRVDPNVDLVTIRKSYKKLAYSVHPDRNKSVAALTAFKILSEAWSLLSNKETRAFYDERRRKKKKIETLMLIMASKIGGSQTGSHYVIKGNGSNQKVNASSNPSQPPLAPSFPMGPSFWTLCNHCCIEFEYDRTHLNKHLKCYKCREHFLAIEIPTPSPLSYGNAVPPYPFKQQNYGPQVLGSQPDCAERMGQPNFSGLNSASNVGATMRPTAYTPSQPSVGTTQTVAGVVTDRWEWKRKYGTKGPGSNARGFSSAVRVPKEGVPQKRKWQVSDQKKRIIQRVKKVAVSAEVVSDSETESDSPVPLTNRRKAAAKEARKMASSAANFTEKE